MKFRDIEVKAIILTSLSPAILSTKINEFTDVYDVQYSTTGGRDYEIEYSALILVRVKESMEKMNGEGE